MIPRLAPAARLTLTLHEKSLRVYEDGTGWRVNLQCDKTEDFPLGIVVDGVFPDEESAINHADKLWFFLSRIPQVDYRWPPRCTPKQFILNNKWLPLPEIARNAQGWTYPQLYGFVNHPQRQQPKNKRLYNSLVKALEYFGYIDYDNPYDLSNILKDE